jgi:hypothetical protein
MSTTKTGQAQTVRAFSGVPTMIPQFVDGMFTGQPYKVEQVLYRDADGGARQHLWLAPDARPHNHPQQWIACACLHGWYRAIEYHRIGEGEYQERHVTLRSGTPEHLVEHDVYHQIVEVFPGTVTVMRYGPTIGDGKDWANLIVRTSPRQPYTVDRNTNQPGFLDALRHLNPYMRPSGWVDPYCAMIVPTIDSLFAAAA